MCDSISLESFGNSFEIDYLCVIIFQYSVSIFQGWCSRMLYWQSNLCLGSYNSVTSIWHNTVVWIAITDISGAGGLPARGSIEALFFCSFTSLTTSIANFAISTGREWTNLMNAFDVSWQYRQLRQIPLCIQGRGAPRDLLVQRDILAAHYKCIGRHFFYNWTHKIALNINWIS